MLVYKPGEKFFWAENLWAAANDGGQRMDSSRYWNTVRSREDFERTRDLWDTGHMEATDYQPGAYHYARGNADACLSDFKGGALHSRSCLHTGNNVLVIFDRVRSTDPNFKRSGCCMESASRS
jgi:hypothetical protein